MVGIQDNTLLKAATGLEGGLVAAGSSCGVVTGGALGLGLFFDDILKDYDPSTDLRVLNLVGDYARFFTDTYGSQLCRVRSGVDFYSAGGQARYFFPGDRMGRCFVHIYGAMHQLDKIRRSGLGRNGTGATNGSHDPVHCAREVLKRVREETGVGHEVMERASLVLDGGVGLSGGVCGAMAGAVMAVNLVLGLDVRNMNFLQTIKAFAIGHGNLLVESSGKTPEPFSVGKTMLANMRRQAGSLECRQITGKGFSSWEEFQEHLGSSEKCTRLIDTAANEAINVISGLGKHSIPL